MILIALGSSLSFCGRTPQEVIESALRAIARIAPVKARSRLYVSPAWPDPADPPFVNAVARVESSIDPHALLAALHAVEAGFGRSRGRPNGPRTLDLDLIDYDGRIVEPAHEGGLALPHPRAAARDFVLAPLAEVAPGWRCPISGETVDSLLARLPALTARPLGGDGEPSGKETAPPPAN